MRIAIVGAGFAGVASAKVLRQLGHHVTVFEKTADIGGVWSATRRYPGLRTQNDKGTYSLSDLPMPRDYPEWPTGQQVQAYLEEYVATFGLAPCIRLRAEVTWAVPAPQGGWDITVAHTGIPRDPMHFDHLVLASGIFSRPSIPDIPGTNLLTSMGGQFLPASALYSLEQVRGRNAIIVGYGKSACDIAVEVATAAASTTVIARELLWKMPRKVSNLLNYKYLMLTRLGEGLFRYRTVTGPEKLLHKHDSALAGNMLGSVEKVTTKQFRLSELGLLPRGTFADIAKSTVSLATEGFFEGVESGDITVKRDTVITRFLEKNGRPCAELSSGEIFPADVVLTATGWNQEIPFLPQQVMDQLTDENGDYLLYRQIYPVRVPDLTFAGYNSSFFSPLSAEISAIWIGSYLGGNHRLPPPPQMEAQVRDRLAWMRWRSQGKHARGTNVIPFSMHNIDEVLSDVGIDVPRRVKALQWLLPPKPGSYRSITPKLARRLGVMP